ncbi:DUF4286 family protein [Candidatus Pantoea bituminis]|uniref:DUF4286 family protein n=1 Tax=Candidatus Pantoea bituminis TaxID=2831036 RepID=UPI001C0637E7|nr:DUF4286 family protein [Pantoea bituminis]
MSSYANGMLFVASDIGPADEADFNRWYDREHIEERVRMEGVISAARYKAIDGKPRHLALYWADSTEVFASPAYARAFVNQSEWSLKTLPLMTHPYRRIGNVEASVGQGSGAYITVLPLLEDLERQDVTDICEQVGQHLATDDTFVRSYVIFPIDELSKSLPQEDLTTRTMRPLFIIESSDPVANGSAMRLASAALPAVLQDAARYALSWKLASSELLS